MSNKLFAEFVKDHFGHTPSIFGVIFGVVKREIRRPSTIAVRTVVFRKEVNFLLKSLLPILSGFVRRPVSISEFQLFITSVVGELDKLKHHFQHYERQKLQGGAKGLFAKLMAGIMVATAMATGQTPPGGYITSTDQQVQNLHRVSSVFGNEILRLGESEQHLKFASEEGKFSLIDNPFFGNVPSAQTTPLYLQDHDPESVEGVLQTVGRKMHLPDNTVLLDYMHFTRTGAISGNNIKMHNDFSAEALDDVQTYVDLDKIQELVPTHITQASDFDTIQRSASDDEQKYLFNEREGGDDSIAERFRSKNEMLRKLGYEELESSYGPTTLLAESEQSSFNEANVHPGKLKDNQYIPQDGENLLAFFRDDFIHGGPRKERKNFAVAIGMAKFAVPREGQDVAYDAIPEVYAKYLSELDSLIDAEIRNYDENYKQKYAAKYKHQLETYRKIKHRFLFRRVKNLQISEDIANFHPGPEAEQFARAQLLRLYTRSGLV